MSILVRVCVSIARRVTSRNGDLPRGNGFIVGRRWLVVVRRNIRLCCALVVGGHLVWRVRPLADIPPAGFWPPADDDAPEEPEALRAARAAGDIPEVPPRRDVDLTMREFEEHMKAWVRTEIEMRFQGVGLQHRRRFNP